MAGWLAIASDGASMDDTPKLMQAAEDAYKLAAIGTWRYTQGIYRIDDDARAALSNTALHGEMPADVLLRLPQWCVYIETPGRAWNGDTMYGFWAHLEHDVNNGRRELRMVLDTERALIPQILHLGNWTVTESITRSAAEAQIQAEQRGLPVPPISDADIAQTSTDIQPLLALVLYLCSDEPEIEDREWPGEVPGRPKPKRTKKGWRLFPPKKPRVWIVGAEIGEQLREHNVSESSGRTVRPHLRRAHWHGFWSGPKTGERKFRYKWLPPIIVAGSDDDE